MISAATSSSEKSTCSPCPVACARRTAASAATARKAAAGPRRDATARLIGLAAGSRAAAEGAALGLDREVGRGASGVGPPQPVGGDREDDQPGMAREQRLAVDRSGRRVLDQQIRARDQRFAYRVVERADHRALGRVEVAEERAVPAAEVGAARRPAAQRVAPRPFELDDVRARVGEELAAVRPGDLDRVVDDAEVLQSVHPMPRPTRPVEPINAVRGCPCVP